MAGHPTPLAWQAPTYSAEHMAQFKSQLPQPKSKWAVRPKQEWYHKHGSGGLDDPRRACPDWLWLEALPVWQQKYSTLGEQGNWQEKYRARCLLCERHLEAATSCGKNSWVNGDGLDPEFYTAEAYQTLRTAKQHGKDEGIVGYFAKKILIGTEGASNTGHGMSRGHKAAAKVQEDLDKAATAAGAAVVAAAAADAGQPREPDDERALADLNAAPFDDGPPNQHTLNFDELNQLGAVMMTALHIVRARAVSAHALCPLHNLTAGGCGRARWACRPLTCMPSATWPAASGRWTFQRSRAMPRTPKGKAASRCCTSSHARLTISGGLR